MEDTYIINFESKYGGDGIFVSKRYKGRKKLTVKLDNKNNTKVMDILKDCYDNTIIIDNKSEYLIVIHNLPMYTYFKIIENKHNGFYDDFDLIHYTSKKIQKYIDKTIERQNWFKLEELNNLHNLNLLNEKKEINIDSDDDDDDDDVNYDKAPVYRDYLYKKSHL